MILVREQNACLAALPTSFVLLLPGKAGSSGTGLAISRWKTCTSKHLQWQNSTGRSTPGLHGVMFTFLGSTARLPVMDRWENCQRSRLAIWKVQEATVRFQKFAVLCILDPLWMNNGSDKFWRKLNLFAIQQFSHPSPLSLRPLKNDGPLVMQHCAWAQDSRDSFPNSHRWSSYKPEIWLPISLV